MAFSVSGLAKRKRNSGLQLALLLAGGFVCTFLIYTYRSQLFNLSAGSLDVDRRSAARNLLLSSPPQLNEESAERLVKAALHEWASKELNPQFNLLEKALINQVSKPDKQNAGEVLHTSAIVNSHNPRLYHTVTTVQGFTNHWQARIHYYWFKRQKAICETQAVCDMGGFTRLLHSGEADDLMDEIPTVVVDKLPESAMKNSNYVVLNRPYAFIQWLQRISIPERYIVMAEADHVFLRPMPNLMPGEAQGAALFTYINPDQYPKIVRSFVGDVSDEELKKVPRIGNSPTFVSVRDFRTLAPAWYNTTMDIFNDEAAHSAWNWVLEMYGYALATYRTGLHKGMATYENMLAHPPWDGKEIAGNGQPFYLLHFTYPLMYNASGAMTTEPNATVWKFDKRAYMDKAPPCNLPDPPANVQNDLARLLIKMFNEATSNIPCWDEYVETGKVTYACAPATSADGGEEGAIGSEGGATAPNSD